MSDYAEEYIEANLGHLGYDHTDYSIEYPDRESNEYEVRFEERLDPYSKQEIDDVFAGQTWWYSDRLVGITFRHELSDEELIDRFLENQYKAPHRYVVVGGLRYEFDEVWNIDWVKGEYPFYFWARAIPFSSDKPDLDVVFKFTREELESMDYRLIDWNEHLDEAKESVYNKRPKKTKRRPINNKSVKLNGYLFKKN